MRKQFALSNIPTIKLPEETLEGLNLSFNLMEEVSRKAIEQLKIKIAEQVLKRQPTPKDLEMFVQQANRIYYSNIFLGTIKPIANFDVTNYSHNVGIEFIPSEGFR